MVEHATEAADPRLEAFHERLAQNSFSAHWQRRERPAPLRPHLWRWSEIHSCLEESGELVGIGGAGEATNRRTIQLMNPALQAQKATTRTFQVSVQLVKPGETAECHRHTFNALRLVVQSAGMHTVAEGEPQAMEPWDLLVQPGWAWHDHTNDTDEPAIWMDLHDQPITSHLDSLFHEVFAEGPTQPVTKPEGYSQYRFGAVRLGTGTAERPSAHKGVAYRYRWQDVLPILEAMAATGDSDPYEGVVLEYVNPATGGPTLPTIGCRVQMLRPGETTRPHRHTSGAVYQAIEGQGVTVLGKGNTEELAWGGKDCFYVPPWHWHQHRNLSAREPAILFSTTDRPMIETLGLYREERG